MRNGRRAPRRAEAAVLTAALALLGTGVAAVTAHPWESGEPATAASARALPADEPAAVPRTTTREASPPSRTAARAVRAAQAATARRAVRARILQPDVLALAPATVAPAGLADLRRRLPGAVVTVASAGTIRLLGHRLAVVGADPAAVARFAPPVTTRSSALWSRIAAGDAAVSFGAPADLRRGLGRLVPVTGGGRLRIGALAAFGLPGVDAVVSPATARRLGLAARRLLVVSAPGHRAGSIATAVRAALGAGAAVDALHTDRPATTATTAAATPADPPPTWGALYRRAATTCPGLPWQVLAAIGTIESGNGRDTSTSSAGAMGPMQFLPSTWAAYGVDADGDGRADIADPADAVYSAARYLCDNGAGRGGRALAGAVYAYNHADWYVADVLGLARRIG